MALITILSRHGSTPRLPGTRMLLSANGIQLGTIGGGSVEAQAVSKAREVLQDGINRVLNFTIGPDNPDSIDMICGGSLDLLVEPLPCNEYNLQLFQSITQNLDKGQIIHVLTPLPDENCRSGLKFCVGKEGLIYGQNIHSDFNNNTAWISQLRTAQIIKLGPVSYLVEPCRPSEKLYIFGAGHLAREVCPLAIHLGFEVTVLDDRIEYLNRERFPDAHRLHLIDSFQNCFQKLTINENCLLLIVTRGHQYDGAVLAQALKTPAFYIGMIGSQRKRDSLYQALIDEGYSQRQLAQVCCPVGLKIGAETPEEIAISITAELVQARAEKRKGR